MSGAADDPADRRRRALQALPEPGDDRPVPQWVADEIAAMDGEIEAEEREIESGAWGEGDG